MSFSSPRPSLIPLVLGFLATALHASGASAGQWQVIPSVAVREEFNDNIFLTERARRSSFISTLTAGVGLLGRTERGGVTVSSRLDRLIYTGDSELDGLEQRHVVQGSYQITPLATLFADASFSHETRPDRYVETSGLLARQESDQQQYAATAMVTLSERLRGEFSGAYQRADYQDSSASDVEGHGLKGDLEYAADELLPQLRLRTAASFNSYRYDTATVQNYGASTGAGLDIGETWSARGDLGVRYTRTSSEGASPPTPDRSKERRDELGWMASLAAVYHGEDDEDRATLALRRDLESAPGRSGAVEATSATALYTKKVSSGVTGSISAGWYRNRSAGGGDAVSETSVRVQPSVLCRLTRELAVEVSYEHARVHDSIERTDVSMNKAFVSFSWQMFRGQGSE